METAAAYQIMSLPTVVAFKNGKPVSSFVGVKDENGVRKFVDDVTREMM
jgi:thioredoxin 1